MQKKDLSVSIAMVNLLSIPILILSVAVILIPFVLMWNSNLTSASFMDFFYLTNLIPVLIIGTIVHELLHGFGWLIFGKQKLSDIKFGINWKFLTPYAHCKNPVKAKVYRAGTILPGIILGIIPSIIAIITGNAWLLYFGIIFTAVAGGDFTILFIIRKAKSDQLIEDHPERAGCYIYE